MNCPSCQTPVDASQRFCQACGNTLAAASAPADPLIGQVLGGKYTVVHQLGEGGMGAVYEGSQTLGTTKRKVAIKTLHPHLSHDAKIKARFEREVGTIAELVHPNTIQVYDFGSTGEGILYIVMEFLEGKSLADLLEKQGPLPPDRAAGILRQVCGSLEEAHAHDIVHRDLKPDNVVLVERAGTKDFVKVLDFGIARRAKEEERAEQKLTQQGTVLGTPPYMSPEQFTGQTVDARSDIYSLGVMAYEMLTGKLPFKANTAWEWASQHINQPPIPIESLAEGMRAPEAMRAAIRRALAKAPGDRFQKVGEFLEAFSGQAPVVVVTDSGVSARQKTEIGAPLDVAAAFGSSGSGGEVGSGGASSGGRPTTQAASNMAVPAPAIPRPPAREESGAHRNTLLAAAGVIAVLSIGAIVFAMRGHGSSAPAAPFDNGNLSAPAPDTTIAPASGGGAPSASAAAEAPAEAPGATGGGDVPALNGVGAGSHPSHPSAPAHPGPGSSSSGATATGSESSHESNHEQGGSTPPSSTGALPAPLPQPPPQAPPVQRPAPARYNGPECQRARQLRALGHPREAENWALQCTMKGGVP
jgi:serine/threonine-protein kinase